MMFKPLDGDSAILFQNGLYRQTDLATRNGFLFAKLGAGYVRLYADGSTSKDGCKLETIATEIPLCRDRMGRLCFHQVAGSKALAADMLMALTDGRS